MTAESEKGASQPDSLLWRVVELIPVFVLTVLAGALILWLGSIAV